MDDAAYERAYDRELELCLADRTERIRWPQTPMATFEWRSGSGRSWTRFGSEISGLLDAVDRVTSGPKGQRFNALLQNPDYAADYEHGYACGRKSGADFGLWRWREEYVTVILQVVKGLTTCVQDPTFLARLTAAAIHEYVLFPQGGHRHAWEDDRYRKLRDCLRSGLPQATAPPQLPVLEDDPQAVPRQAASWVAQTAELTHYGEDLGVLDAIDIVGTELVSDLREEVVHLFQGIVELNDYPMRQGFFCGWCIGLWNVQTLRWIVETAAELESPL